MLNVLILRPLVRRPNRTRSAETAIVHHQSDHAVASRMSKEFGVWNHDRVKPRFRFTVSVLES